MICSDAMIYHKKMRFWLVIISTILVISIIPTGAGGITHVFDQGDENHNWAFSGTFNLDSAGVQGQSFVPSTNEVSKVEFYLTVTTAGNVTLMLTNTYDNNLPVGGEILGQVNQTVTSDGWIEFVFSSPISVTASTTHYLILVETSGSLNVRNGSDSLYSSGNAYNAGSIPLDFLFVTYYSAPPVNEFPFGPTLFIAILSIFVFVYVLKRRVRDV